MSEGALLLPSRRIISLAGFERRETNILKIWRVVVVVAVFLNGQ